MNPKLQTFISNRRAAGDTDAQIRAFLAAKGVQIPPELQEETKVEPFAGEDGATPGTPEAAGAKKGILEKSSDIVTGALTGAQKFLQKTVPDAAEKVGTKIGGKTGGEIARSFADVPGNLGTIAGAGASAVGAGAAFEARQRVRENPILSLIFGEEKGDVVAETSQLGQFAGEAGGRAAPLAAITGNAGAVVNAATAIPMGYSAWRAAKSGKLLPTQEDIESGNLFDNAALAIPMFALSALGAVGQDKILPFGLEKKFASPEIKAIANATHTAKTEFSGMLDDGSKIEDATDVLDDIPDDDASKAYPGPGAQNKPRTPSPELLDRMEMYRGAAKASYKNNYNEAPWQIAGDEADEAVGELRSLVRIYGKAKGDILAKAGQTEVPGLESVQESFKQSVADRLGLALSVDDSGHAVFSKIPGKIPKVTADGAEAKFLADVWDNGLGYLDDTDTVQYVDEAVDAIQSRIAKAAPSGTGTKGFVVTTASPIDDNATAIAKQTSGDLNKALYAAADPTYKEINTLYSIFRSVHDKLSKSLGPEGSRAENLIVRVFSRTGGATRRLFKDVEILTGRDLIGESTMAKAAMEEVGDLRAFGLPEDIVGDIAKGKPGLGMRFMKSMFGVIGKPLRRMGDDAVLRGADKANPGPGAMGSGDPLPIADKSTATMATGGAGDIPENIGPINSNVAARVADDILAATPEQIAAMKQMIADGTLPAAFADLIKSLGKW